MTCIYQCDDCNNRNIDKCWQREKQMTEQRYIRWKVTTLDGGLFALQITDQSHRDFNWGANNGVLIRSYVVPEYWASTLCVRGRVTSQDNKPLILTADQLALCEQALNEHNFAHSSYAEEWEIVEFGHPDWHDHIFNVDAILEVPETYKGRHLIVRRKQPPVPIGEACVGCLCWVWDSEDDNTKDIAFVSKYLGRDYNGYWPYRTYACKYSRAIPLTPDEVMEYYEKAKAAWRKKLRTYS